MSTKECCWKYLSAVQLSVTISKLNSALCFPGVNRAWREVAADINGSFPGIHSGSRVCASRIWPTSPKYLSGDHKQ